MTAFTRDPRSHFSPADPLIHFPTFHHLLEWILNPAACFIQSHSTQGYLKVTKLDLIPICSHSACKVFFFLG